MCCRAMGRLGRGVLGEAVDEARHRLTQGGAHGAKPQVRCIGEGIVAISREQQRWMGLLHGLG